MSAPHLCKKKMKEKEKQRKAFPFGSKTTATTEKRFSLNSIHLLLLFRRRVKGAFTVAVVFVVVVVVGENACK